ncbi:hypothetical protein AGMMS4957_01120 [Bacteroidia bacterium]|nr:hypothetical protein AGMMS4957_01120 [Bacteroidia bacterium]
MTKVRIKIGIIGYLPFDFNRKMIRKSKVFEIIGEVKEYPINVQSDLKTWGYSDKTLEKVVPPRCDEDFFIGITYVPVENDYCVRRLSNNRIVLSYNEMHRILKENHIPQENLLLRALYEYSLVYLRNSNKIPQTKEDDIDVHHDTRGCLFDMYPNLSDIVYSLAPPKLCDACVTKIRSEEVPETYIKQIQKELPEINKSRFYRIWEWVKQRPIWSIIISALFGISLSLIATIIYELLLKGFF